MTHIYTYMYIYMSRLQTSNHIDINDFNLQLNEILQQVSSRGHKCIVPSDFKH